MPDLGDARGSKRIVRYLSIILVLSLTTRSAAPSHESYLSVGRRSSWRWEVGLADSLAGLDRPRWRGQPHSLTLEGCRSGGRPRCRAREGD